MYTRSRDSRISARAHKEDRTRACSDPQSPECVESVFCELRPNGVLRSWYSPGPAPMSEPDTDLLPWVVRPVGGTRSRGSLEVMLLLWKFTYPSRDQNTISQSCATVSIPLSADTVSKPPPQLSKSLGPDPLHARSWSFPVPPLRTSTERSVP
jgi:hypothetical protein